MDINQLKYFINIVECGFNLSLAARKIHISQSALSQFITNFENDEQLILFNRKQNGRLESLTSAGQKIYQHAQRIVALYDEMEETVRRESARQRGTIRIGIPSLVLRVFFSSFIPKFIFENKHIQIEFVEDGTLELRKMLIEKELNCAVLIEPTNLDLQKFDEHVIQIDEMTAFCSTNHPLSSQNTLDWEDIMAYPLATFNKNFMTYRLVREKIDKIDKTKSIQFLSSSWDYLIEATVETDIVTILPAPIHTYLSDEQIQQRKFADPIPFNVHLCRPIKDKYSAVEQMVYESILDYFYQPMDEENQF
jgi:DNA-binding transcriptional LysR family regulator